MLPIINFLGYKIGTYSLFIITGLIIGSVLAIYFFSKYNNVKKEDILYSILYGVIGLGVGGKILYVITNISAIINNYQNLGFINTVKFMTDSGFVFYGGLIGAILGILIYSKQFKVSFKDTINTLIPVIPLVHAIGRIGCFFAGCCYGMPYNGIGHVIFHNTQYAPINIALFPSQLVEAFCNSIIFVVLCLFYKKYLGTNKTVGLYCILYSTVRFILEFYRGDVIRGSILILSTSQWISLIIFIIGGIVFYMPKSKKCL